MADKDNKMEKSIKEAIGKSLNEFNKKIGMAKIIKDNKNQDRILKGILSQVNDENTEKTEKSNVITLDNSTDGIVELKEIKGDTNVNVSKMEKETPITHVIDDKYGNVISLDGITEGVISIDDIEGNTMVNCCKDGSKELTLNGDIDTSGYNNVTLTEGVDGGKVDVVLEGNTMVNVCDQEEPVAITKNYEVSTGNHVALQGEYDGKCRPNIYGNTLVSWQGSKDVNKGQQVTINSQYQTKGIHTLNTTVGDKVYFRIKFTVDEMNTTSPDPKIFTGYSMGYKIDVKAFKDCTVGKIEEASTIREHEQAHADQNRMDLCIGMYAPMPEDVPAGGVVCKYTIHDYVIYNLTQLFGAGKEPQQEWCDKNLPYLEGMQSSFEDKLITDEKDAHNGKYKVDYKVTGKNKFDKSKTLNGYEITDVGNGTIGANLNWFVTDFIPVIPNTSYKISGKANGNAVLGYNENKQFITNFPNAGTVGITIPNNVRYIKLNGMLEQKDTFQLEEGDTATTYEPYKEYTKTLYLNTPLLEGDTIEQSGNDIVHVHRYNTVTFDGSDDENWVYWGNNTDNGKLDSSLISFYLPFTNYKDVTTSTVFNNKFLMGNTVWGAKTEIMALNGDNIISFQVALLRSKLATQDVAGFKTWLQANPITVAYELATPTQEVISTNDNLLLDSYVNGHLDVDSVVPIDKVEFKSQGKFLQYLSPNTEYTIQFESDNVGTLYALALNDYDTLSNLNIVKGINKFNITTKDTIHSNYLWTSGIGFNMSKVVVTPKVEQTFGYFKGMKSVGECEGNVVEVVAQNKNLYDGGVLAGSIIYGDTKKYNCFTDEVVMTNSPRVRSEYPQAIHPNTEYNITVTNYTGIIHLLFYDKNGNYLNDINFINSSNEGNFTSPLNAYYLHFFTKKEVPLSITNENYKVFLKHGYGSIDYVEPKSNKKEILMNEPLRGLPNGVRDKYVMIDNKWYIERNTVEENFSKYNKFWNEDPENEYFKRYYMTSFTKDFIIDTLPRITKEQWNSYNVAGVYLNGTSGAIGIIIPKGLTISEYIGNSIIVHSPISYKPTYEPIEYNPFEVYSDITHISNNSIIPCNMIIKNSGYNCILKPSTLYTIALDTNKSGTVGMNLGGAKGTTSNNVTTITTPATLTDNTLRLYGKGIKGSKVRLLEGDKTNWIPSHFEGMKSCFEDKLQDDGKYKMEILSRNSDESLSNKIQFLLNKPLRGVGDVKDKVYVKEDKIIVQRNCGSVTFDGSDTWNLNKIENNIYTYSIRSTKFLTKMKVGTWETLMNNKCYIIDKCGTATTSTPKNEQLLIHNTVEDKFIWYSTPLFSTVQSVKQYLNDNPFKILYQLETPVYEEVEYSNNRLTLDTYDNSTLIYDSNIPVSNTSFKPLWEELVYVKNSTTYYIQFNAVGSGNVVVNLGGTELSTTITEGYNKIEITTPNNSTNLLTIDGQGIKISKVVVSEALCSGYYKGLQSCFEEHMENGKYVCVIRGISLDGSKVNGIKFYLNEPLRGIGDIKDKLCIKDNKLMVERNFIQVIIDGENLQNYNNFAYRTLFDFKCNVLHNWELANFITDSKFSNAFIDYQWNHRDFESIAVSPLDEKTCIDIIDKSISFSIDSYKNILKEKPIKVVYQLLEPIYEEITNEYGLPIILEGYENGIVYVDSAVTPTTSIKYTSNNTVPTTLSNVDNLNTTTQDDINNNIVTYMMDIDMMLTEMEMEDNASTMSLSDSDDNNQKHNTSHNNILDRMNKEDRIKYQDNTTKMLEKVIKGKSLTNEENINRIDLYLSEGKIREEQSNYLKELLKEGE